MSQESTGILSRTPTNMAPPSESDSFKRKQEDQTQLKGIIKGILRKRYEGGDYTPYTVGKQRFDTSLKDNRRSREIGYFCALVLLIRLMIPPNVVVCHSSMSCQLQESFQRKSKTLHRRVGEVIGRICLGLLRISLEIIAMHSRLYGISMLFHL